MTSAPTNRRRPRELSHTRRRRRVFTENLRALVELLEIVHGRGGGPSREQLSKVRGQTCSECGLIIAVCTPDGTVIAADFVDRLVASDGTIRMVVQDAHGNAVLRMVTAEFEEECHDRPIPYEELGEFDWELCRATELHPVNVTVSKAKFERKCRCGKVYRFGRAVTTAG